MTTTTPELKRYAKEAGLKQQDMPPANHPLMENDAEVRTLGDLVDARREALYDNFDEGDSDDGRTLSDSNGPIDPEDEYMTRADFIETAMLSSDPDEDAGDDEDETILGAGLDRAPDISGTVIGLARGMSTHLPLDQGANGFRIVEPEDVYDTRASVDLTNADLADALELLAEIDPYDSALADDDEEFDGHLIPISRGLSHIDSADDALDGTRRLR